MHTEMSIIEDAIVAINSEFSPQYIVAKTVEELSELNEALGLHLSMYREDKTNAKVEKLILNVQNEIVDVNLMFYALKTILPFSGYDFTRTDVIYNTFERGLIPGEIMWIREAQTKISTLSVLLLGTLTKSNWQVKGYLDAVHDLRVSILTLCKIYGLDREKAADISRSKIKRFNGYMISGTYQNIGQIQNPLECTIIG